MLMDTEFEIQEETLENLKSDILLAWRRIYKDRSLRFEDYHKLDVNVKSTANNSLIATCCILWRFYSSDYHKLHDIREVDVRLFN